MLLLGNVATASSILSAKNFGVKSIVLHFNSSLFAGMRSCLGPAEKAKKASSSVAVDHTGGLKRCLQAIFSWIFINSQHPSDGFLQYSSRAPSSFLAMEDPKPMAGQTVKPASVNQRQLEVQGEALETVEKTYGIWQSVRLHKKALVYSMSRLILGEDMCS